ncbi:MAG TPA: UDP-N-acetylmuramoyl-L-alanyl-D-glutamate--2,6-diaminopimelate ligase [Candidatus Binataceae bacterium]|nr:UDP-N-acetylmuramoyl-L-alanyl-D-glutamate--2,6-diaminopimelate ligase [Candidatus Binataceae bacterium]
MKLRSLLSGLDYEEVKGDAEVEVGGLSYDSRKSGPESLFFSLTRDAERSRANIKDALNRGVRAVVMRGGGDGEAARAAATIVRSERPRLLMGAAASRFFNAPSERIDLVGVTGTSGKTTTTYLLQSIFEAAGLPTGIIGTVGIFIRGRKVYSGLTTPESVDFESSLAEMEREGVKAAAAEVSSVGIAEGRVEYLNFRGCLFTNLGRDHLDLHGTIENYFAAKLRLFTEILPHSRRTDTVAVSRGDDPYGRRVLDAVKGRKVSFGFDSSLDAHPIEYQADLSGIHGTISVLGKKLRIESSMVGEPNLLNILGASALSVALGIDGGAVEEGARRCPGAPGRMEAIAAKPGVNVLVDYAHKPDALDAVLRTVRKLTPGRIICVFGCGGDRDRGKRPVMGEIAARLSDIPIVTSDNPRTEKPLAIISEIEEGLKKAGRVRGKKASSIGAGDYLVEPDRRAAIFAALQVAVAGDTVLVAGKGHENYQLLGSDVIHFDDREVVRELAAELNRG